MRTYILCKRGTLIGNFSNRKNLWEAIKKIEPAHEKLFFKGVRANTKVDELSIGRGFKNKFLRIYTENDDVSLYQVWENTLNTINPEFEKKG